MLRTPYAIRQLRALDDIHLTQLLTHLIPVVHLHSIYCMKQGIKLQSTILPILLSPPSPLCFSPRIPQHVPASLPFFSMLLMLICALQLLDNT